MQIMITAPERKLSRREKSFANFETTIRKWISIFAFQMEIEK